MPEPILSEEQKAAAEAATKEAKDKADAEAKAKAEADGSSQIKKELERAKSPKTKREKILYKQKQLEDELSKLDEEDGQAPIVEDDEDDAKPLTVGDFKKMQKKEAQKTALTLADDIEDDDERELVKHYLQNRVIPSGNPTEDLKFARAAVNSLKNQQIAEEIARKKSGKTSSSGSGSPGRVDDPFEPTAEELSAANFAKKKTPEDIKKFILKAREAQK